MARFNSFEGGTNGVTLTPGSGGNTGGASGDFFDAATAGAGATLVFDTTSPIVGTRSLLTATGATSTTAYVGYALANVTSDRHRSYHKLDAMPSAARILLRYMNGGTQAYRVSILNTGQIRVHDTAGVQAGTTTAAASPGVPFRLEIASTFSATAGAIELRLFTSLHSLTPAEVLTLTSVPMTATVNELRMGVGSGTANAVAARHDAVAVEGSDWFGPAVAAGTVVHAWVGAPTSAGFTVKAKMATASSVQLVVATDEAMTAVVGTFGPAAPDADGYVALTATGLASNGAYYWRLQDVGVAIGSVGRARTLPTAGAPTSFTFAFGGCTTNNATQAAALNDIRAWNPAFFLHLGDFHYRDPNSSTVSVHRGHWETQILGAAGLAQLLREVPIIYTRSDHDAGPGDNLDSNNASNQASINAYKQIVPHLPLADVRNPTVGLYQSWVVGRVRFVMVDIRNMDRSPGLGVQGPSKTMLGSTQLAWLLSELSQPEPLKFLITDVAWMGDNPTPVDAQDKWPAYDNERQTIINHITANNIKVIVLHSDTHSLGRATSVKNTYGGFPVWCAAPLSNIGGGRYLDTFTEVYNTAAAQGSQYGRVSVTDSGGAISVTYDGYDALGGVARITQTESFGAAEAGDGISYGDTGTVANTSSSTSIVVPKPPTAAEGDHLTAVIAYLKTGTPETTTVTVPPGFTLLGERTDGTGLRLAVYTGWRTSGVESYTWTISEAFKGWGAIIAHRGVHTSNPVREFAFADYNTGAVFTSPSVTAEDGDWLVTAIGTRHTATGAETTWSSSAGADAKRFQVSSNGITGQDVTGAVFDSAGPVGAGAQARVLTSSQSESLIAAVSVLLRPESAPTTPVSSTYVGWGINI